MSRSGWIRIAGFYLLAACLLTWPLAIRLTTSLGATEGSGDPYLNLWILGWDLHAWTSAPLSVFSGRVFDLEISDLQVLDASGSLEPVMSTQDGTLVALPVGPDHALMPSLLTLSDVMGTGHHAALRANVRPGKAAAVDGADDARLADQGARDRQKRVQDRGLRSTRLPKPRNNLRRTGPRGAVIPVSSWTSRRRLPCT